MLFSGKAVAEDILQKTRTKIEQAGITPGLGVILVGNDAPSHLYVGIKEKRAKELHILFEKKIFSANVTEKEILTTIVELNQRSDIHGIIVQLPLPEHFDTDGIIAAIDPNKDTDGFHPETIEKFLNGDSSRLPVFPRAMLELVKAARPQKEDEIAIAAVNSDLMGKVLARGLVDAGYRAEYILADDIHALECFQKADVVLTALGSPSFFSTRNAKDQAILIDGGISYDSENNVVGDISRDDSVYRNNLFVTPVPGGVGPVTVAVLLARVTEAALQR